MLKEVTTLSFTIEWTDLLTKGMEYLSHKKFDIVLLDLMLPDSEGIDTFIYVYNHVQNIPIIVLSGLNDETVAINAVQQGAQDYIVKGKIDGDLLARAIHYAIERKKTEAVLRESEKKYKELADALPQTVFEMEKNGNLTFVNQNAFISFGYTRITQLSYCAYKDPLQVE